MEANFVPLRETVELLKSNAIELDLGLVGEEEALDFLERAPLAWDNTVNKTFRVKESIQPLQNAMVDFIKRCDRRVLRCCGAFTLLLGLVSRNDGGGWFYFRIRGRSDRVGRPRFKSRRRRRRDAASRRWRRHDHMRVHASRA